MGSIAITRDTWQTTIPSTKIKAIDYVPHQEYGDLVGETVEQQQARYEELRALGQAPATFAIVEPQREVKEKILVRVNYDYGDTDANAELVFEDKEAADVAYKTLIDVMNGAKKHVILDDLLPKEEETVEETESEPAEPTGK